MTTEGTASARQLTIAKQAMRKLGETELQGLGYALTSLENCEAVLLDKLLELAALARHEDRTRKNAGHPRPGPIVQAFHTTRELAYAIDRCRDELTPIVRDRPRSRGGKPYHHGT